jgi:hypothetical protein
MRRSAYAVVVLLTCAFSGALLAQNRSAELDKAYEDTRAAFLALQEAEKRRDAGLTPEPGERSGTAAGGASRPNEQYFGRQMQLEHEVELARKRYEAAAKRWNDLK